MDIKGYFERLRKEIDRALDANLPKSSDILSKAMRYSVFSGGKRFRPILAVSAARVMGAKAGQAVLPACAVELVHNFTLIHDDLPCMDDDDYRRGKPTLHKKYNEAVAVLAGDALLNLSFSILSGKCDGLDPFVRMQLVKELSDAVGPCGLLGGQVKDVSLRGQSWSFKDMEDVYAKKTAALISAALRIGAVVAGAGKTELDILSDYGRDMGIAFQVTDDIIEFMSGQAERKRNEMNCVSRLNLKKARDLAKNKIESAKKSLRMLDRDISLLSGIADYIITRKS